MAYEDPIIQKMREMRLAIAPEKLAWPRTDAKSGTGLRAPRRTALIRRRCSPNRV
jgi:hypothetical protein